MVLYLHVEIPQNDQIISSWPLINREPNKRWKNHMWTQRGTHAKRIKNSQKETEYQLTQIEKLIEWNQKSLRKNHIGCLWSSKRWSKC